ncbi:MAG: hypothetical protein AVDCRST_MAG66-740 [uncultured Pseudonocardia sp.]|uniref:Uncharacterized protein n=1 Tax=uncultured Pseudonocardia sp. TaxID=211455 RepID=A0A6J4NIG6_9PSEU|nr:MAG: hypothetical protein AVDCRST_MAG66-740 [uncultured Pseudonocardia sp.]
MDGSRGQRCGQVFGAARAAAGCASRLRLRAVGRARRSACPPPPVDLRAVPRSRSTPHAPAATAAPRSQRLRHRQPRRH